MKGCAGKIAFLFPQRILVMIKYVFGVLLLFIGACKSAQPGAQAPAKPMEQYEDKFQIKTSMINIPVRIGVADLEQSLNQQLNGVIYEDKDFNDGDNMTIKATKRDQINIQMEGQQVKYRVPLSLLIKYDIGITKVEAVGDIALNFQTSFSIKPNWALETSTTVNGYEWLQQPRLKMAGVSLPVGFIADLVLKNSKQTLAKGIDEQVKEQLDLGKIMGENWKKMFDPVLVAPEYNTWLQVNPQSISMTPLKLDNDQITSTIIVESKPAIKIGERPKTLPAPVLPNFKYAQTATDDFILFLDTDISYTEAERLANANLAGQTFIQGKKFVKVEKIEFYGQGENLVVNTFLSGSYNGSVYLTGRPEFDFNKNTIDIRDLKFTLETENFLYKSAAWLLKSTIKKKIQENMNFLLDDNLKAIQTQLQQQLANYVVAPGIRLNGQLNQLNIQNAYLSRDGIKVQLGLSGKVNLLVSQLN